MNLIIHQIVLDRLQIARLRLIAVDQYLLVRHPFTRRTRHDCWLADESARAREKWKERKKEENTYKVNVEMSRTGERNKK